LEQLTWHWTGHLRPKLDGLTDDEYFWEPAAGAWSVRRRGSPGAVGEVGGGDWTIDFALPEPSPPPVTTIAWRLGHLIVGVFGARAASHFADPPDPGGSIDYGSFHYAGSAAEALDQLDAVYAAWTGGVARLDDAALRRAMGPAEGDFAEHPMADLVLHISREAIHHGAEILLLRDLYRTR
jgi:hypothetical protein